jgi:tRNA (guanine-N7-)-methyltransferase
MGARTGERSTEAFFGRRRGKPLTGEQAGLMESLLPRLRLDLARPAPAPIAGLFDHAPERVRLEIGFGGGEHLMKRSAELPDWGFIGIEPFVNGMAKLVKAMALEPRDNLRLYDDDATRVLDWLPAASIDHIDLNYPDPWPKPRHFKRRFVSPVNLDRFARVLKPGGRFNFASDIDTYVNWTLNHCDRHPAFDWLAESADDWHRPYRGWPGTRYEAKAIREGRRPAYLRFVRTGGPCN